MASRESARDPLAELARLIGQADPHGPSGRYGTHQQAETTDDSAAASGFDWAADERYADQNPPAVEHDASPAPAQSHEAYPADPAYSRRDRRFNEEPADRAYSAAAPLSGAREDVHDFHGHEQQPGTDYDEEQEFAPAYDDRYEPEHGDTDGQSYDAEAYEAEAAMRRRSASILVLAVLGLAVFGTAGAFAYRAMFGSSMLPSLPPIIKASDGPNKIMPSNGASQARSSQSDGASGGANEKLVSHDEQPVDVQQLVKPVPHVVSTIPVFPDPNSPGGGMPETAPPGPVFPPPGMSVSGLPTPSVAAPVQIAGPASSVAVPEPRKVHTVVIRPDQPTNTPDAAAPRPARIASARPPASRPAINPAPRADANAPLALVPQQGGEPETSRMRTARATSGAPATRPASPGGSGYAVQITSQRSEAGAHAAFRSMKAKYPAQLGDREPIFRRANLGAKGVYYRALVGPFASMEQAAGMCSSLKAAGGNCIVQRN
jgi:hypothetical protein